MRAHPVRLVTALLLVAALGLAACGTGTGTGDPPAATAAAVPEQPVLEVPPDTVPEGTLVVTAGENTGVDLDDLADSIEERLSAAGHPAAFAEVLDAEVRVQPGDGPLDADEVEALLSSPGRLEIRPVRRERGPRHCEDVGAQGVGEDSTYPEHADGDGDDLGEIVTCYVLAPGGVTNTAIESAFARPSGVTADDGTDEWAVDLVLTFDGIDAFNEMAGACKRREAPCDRGLAAIALDQVVLSAPRVQDANFTRTDIQISGIADEAEANALAAALTTAALPRGLDFTN